MCVFPGLFFVSVILQGTTPVAEEALGDTLSRFMTLVHSITRISRS